jgi:lipoate-protein ligase A
MPVPPQRSLLRVDHSLPSPAEYLAADEALLDQCENGLDAEILAFWEPREPFVVVGYANKIAREVNLAACEKAGIPVFRRCSGGGTVVQLPGGLNYGLILRITEDGPLHSITSANSYIMEKNRSALATLLPQTSTSDKITVRGHTDLCLGNLKFAGNSQRRRKHYLLFHGTFLLDCNLKLVGELLQMPSLEPDYRANRAHEEFVTNLKLPAPAIKSALAQVWHADTPFENPPLESIRTLAREKYSIPAWNQKF